jgi:hypothetical protein
MIGYLYGPSQGKAFPSTGSSHTGSAEGPETGRNFTKDVKIEGTNSASPLESTKVSKNELKKTRN